MRLLPPSEVLFRRQQLADRPIDPAECGTAWGLDLSLEATPAEPPPNATPDPKPAPTWLERLLGR